MNRLLEIEQRLSEISKDIETRGAEINAEALDALEKEVKELKEERVALKAAQEKRTNLLASIAAGGTSSTQVRSFENESKEDKDPLETLEYRKAFMAHVLKGTAIPEEYRANAVTATTDVGAVIPTTVLNKVIEKLEVSGMILQLVTRTSYKGGVSIPTSSIKPVATWVAQGAGSDKQKKTTGSIIFAYHKLRCAVAVSLEVENMALSAFEATMISNINDAMTIAIEQAIITGSGTGQPKGILSETVDTKKRIKSVTPSYNDLIEAEAALPQAYESGAVWCMSKKTFMLYYGMTDQQGQPIGRVNYGIAGKPERSLLGRTVVVCDYVTSYDASLAAAAKFGFLFDFKDYVLNTNYSMGVKKYEDNETDDIVTKAVMIVDGKSVDINSLVVLEKKAA